MHFVSALDKVSGMRTILGLHETVCSGAADGYGRMLRKPALTLLHLGPGLANALANLHNARRASTPVLNLVGDMATWHAHTDPLLSMDISALASTVSKSVDTCEPHDSLTAAMVRAAANTKHAETVSGSRISTLIVPHNVSWTECKQPLTPGCQEKVLKGTANAAGSTLQFYEQQSMNLSAKSGIEQFIKNCSNAIKRCPKGKSAFLIGGRAAISDGDAIANMGKIAVATGADLICENAFARLDRGSGMPNVQRLPYFPNVTNINSKFTDSAALIVVLALVYVKATLLVVASSAYANWALLS